MGTGSRAGGKAAQPTSCPAARCRATLRWVRLVSGASVPVDAGLDPCGQLVPVWHQGERRVRARTPRDHAQPGFTPHWSTCPDPVVWRQVRQHANRRGELAALTRERTAAQGPCAGCRDPHHVRYGTGADGTLCPACTAILTAWRALPREQRNRTPLVYPDRGPTRRRTRRGDLDDAE